MGRPHKIKKKKKLKIKKIKKNSNPFWICKKLVFLTKICIKKISVTSKV